MSTNTSWFDDDQDETGDVSVAGQVSKRQLIVLAVDTSYSMNALVAPDAVPGSPEHGRRRIDELNDAIQEWLPRVRAASELRSAEFAIVTYGNEDVVTLQSNGKVPPECDGGAFVPSAKLTIPPFAANGVTPMTRGIRQALELARMRRAYLRSEHSLQSSLPRIITITDGWPTDADGKRTDDWRALAAQLHRQRASKESIFVAFGVPGADDAVLEGLAGRDGFVSLARVDFPAVLDLVLVASSADDPFGAIRRLKEGH